VAFRFSDEFQKSHPDLQQKWIQTLLRTKGWSVVLFLRWMSLISAFRIVPNYDLAPDLSQIDILRVVVKENFTEALLDRLVADLVRVRAS
jgi:glutamate decarboxylase